MTEKIKNIAIAVAVVVVAVAYLLSVLTVRSTAKRTNDYYNHLDKSRAECLREGDNAEKFYRYDSYGYDLCMRYRGFEMRDRQST